MASGGIKLKALKPKPNYFFSIVSVSLVLFLVGIFLFMSMHSNALIKTYKEQINVIIEMKEDVSPQQSKELGNYLATLPEIKNGSIEYISKEDGLILLQEDLGEDFLLKDMPNPLFDIYTVHVESEDDANEAIARVKDRIMTEQQTVHDVYYQSSLYETIQRNLQKVGLIILIISLIIVFVAVILIHNVNKLALYANRFLIRNMELVGASWSFIIRPFLRKSLYHGLISACISLVLLSGLIYLLWLNVPEVQQVITWQSLGTIALVVIVGSVLLTLASTWLVVNKYLRMRFNDLF
ncbi:MAG: permease-like cell division protein FtsX [Saprospiraceae bacterium]